VVPPAPCPAGAGIWHGAVALPHPNDAMMVDSKTPVDFFLEDEVRLRKPHPCGSVDWTVVRLGADIGLRCHGCGRRVLLPRRVLEKRMKAFLSRGPSYEAARAAVDALDLHDSAPDDEAAEE
jgi:hypothetical protein